jgi:hypothetical protein
MLILIAFCDCLAFGGLALLEVRAPAPGHPR